MSIAEEIYKKLLLVPRGRVTTYGELARAVGLKNGQRAVGRIMNQNPYPGIVPCHRVVMSDGKVGGFAYGTKIKSKMLSNEGIRIKDGKVLDWDDAVYRF